MSPTENGVYAGYLFNLGLVGEVERDTMLENEERMKNLVSTNEWYSAYQVSSWVSVPRETNATIMQLMHPPTPSILLHRNGIVIFVMRRK